MIQTTLTRRILVGSAAFALVHSIAGAQDSTTTHQADTAAARPAPSASAPSLPFDFSGVIYTNFQKGGLKGARAQNRFDVERAYLTFRGNAGERVSWRITADIFQQRDTTLSAFYRGWALRAKYAYAQYDYLRGGRDQLRGNVRLGLVHTAVIDHEEQAWPRGIQQVAVEQAGFFSSSDGGIAATVALPNQAGELYATVTNGTGYTSREVDRFKDYAARLTLTPLATSHGYWKGLNVSPWISLGRRASDFADRRHGTVSRVDEGRRRDRYGLLMQVRDPRVSLGAHIARRIDVVESADTTRDATPATLERTGGVTSVYATVHPFAFTQGADPWPVALLFRADDVKPDRSADPYHRFYVAGITWALNKKTSITFDYQTQVPKEGSRAQDLKTYFVHVIANF